MTRYPGSRAVVAVVAGSTADIGLAIAKRLVEGGATVLYTAASAARRSRAAIELGSAGRVMTPADLAAAHIDELDMVFAGSAPAIRPVLPRLRDGGSVVLIAPITNRSVQALAGELAARAVRVNAVSPGCLEAPDHGVAALPLLGRLGSAEEVARAAIFLATEATFTTGARLPVDGGVAG